MGWPKIRRKIIQKNLTVPKNVAQCRKPTHSTQHYLNTVPKTYPTLIHRGEDPSRLSDAIAYLNIWGSSPAPWLSCSPIYYYVYICWKKYLFKKIFQILSQCRKLSHSAENTLFHILILWAELYPILIYWPELYPILIHCRNIPYLNTWPADPSRPWAQVGCYSLS